METIVTVVLFSVIALICVVASIDYIKKLRCGCCASGGDTGKRVKVSDRNPENYKICVLLHINSMACGRCKAKVENALNAKENVWAEVNLKDGIATVRMKEPLPDEALRRIVSRAGYTVDGIERIA